jgi:hypothetical protein
VLKILPFNLPQSNLQINYSHSESLGKPLYIPGTDIRVDEAVEQINNSSPDTSGNGNQQTADDFISSTQTLTVSNTLSAANIKFFIPTSLWYIRDTFNALTFAFNYNNSFSRSPTVLERKNWVWNASANYSVNFSTDLFIQPSKFPIIGWLFALLKDYRDAKINFAPKNFSASVSTRRNRNSNTTRPTGNIKTDPLISRDFTAARGFNFSWILTEGGLLNLSTNYNVSISSSLAYLLVDENDQEKSEAEIWNEIFGGEAFGKDYAYQQTLDFRAQPRLPSFWDINRYFTLTAGYSVNYRWDYDLRQEELGRSAGFSSKSSAGLVLRWKALTEPLFGSPPVTNNQTRNRTTGRNRTLDQPVSEEDQTTKETTDEGLDSLIVTSDQKPSSIIKAFNFFKSVIKTIFFDWDSFSFNFSNTHGLSKSGLKSEGTGFLNFWGTSFSVENGPSREFMLGFSNDAGPRAEVPNTNLRDIFSEKNNFDFRTSRPLWEGAKIDVTWKVGWGVNKNTTLTTDAEGNLFVSNVQATGNLSRSFLSLPLGYRKFK